MRFQQPLKKILAGTRQHWSRDTTRLAVRKNFEKVINCRTPALGAEIYASETEKKLVYHTCKSKSCPSCGHRATIQWQREQWASLPDIRYTGIVFTMPQQLWPIFQHNRHLLHDLPALGAAVISQWMKIKHSVRVMTIVVPHTFGSQLKFKPHLHILTSAGGLHVRTGRWVPRLQFDKGKLMHMWRFAVITFLRQALAAGIISSDLQPREIRALLTEQYRWWSVHVDYFASKTHLLRYGGRYVRRPPIAQHRFTKIADDEIQFWYKDKRTKTRAAVRGTPEEFVDMLAEHVPNHYQHSVRKFGLLAPRTKGQTSAAIFLFLKQQMRPRPRRLSWAFSVQRDFGVNPLLDSGGRIMQWAGRCRPTATVLNDPGRSVLQSEKKASTPCC